MTNSPLRSTFANDPDMAELVRLFVDELPTRIRAVEVAWSEQRLSDLRRLAHQLRGAGGGYGFPAISGAAGEVEDRLRVPEADLEDVRRRLDDLIDLCRSVIR